MEQTDHTAAIFSAFGMTPDTHPWAYKNWSYYTGEGDCEPISLLSDSIEADGLAVRLVEIALEKRLIQPPRTNHSGDWIILSYSKLDAWHSITRENFARAVHDALVEALGITSVRQMPKEERK